MELGKVVGQVVSTVRDSGLPNLTFLLVEIVDGSGKKLYGPQIAADTLGAGEDEYVMLCRGSSARLILENGRSPVDLSVVGIVDQISCKAKTIYNK